MKSDLVQPPCIEECPVHMEAELMDVHEMMKDLPTELAQLLRSRSKFCVFMWMIVSGCLDITIVLMRKMASDDHELSRFLRSGAEEDGFFAIGNDQRNLQGVDEE